MGGYQRRYDNQPRGNPETDEGKEQKSGLIILQKSKDLMQYLYTSWVKYPRSEKPGFVADYKQCLFQFLIYIITAQKKYFKKTTLQDADVQLELLRLFNQLSYDMRFIDEKRYKLISERLCEIGRLLGGWINSQKEASKTTGKFFPVGLALLTLADRGCELQQHFQFRAFGAEFEQPAFLREHGRRLLFRLPF